MLFPSQGQLAVFCTCLAYGLLLGILKSLFVPPRPLFQKPLFQRVLLAPRVWQAVLDFLFFTAALPAFILLSYLCRFPTFRPYMAAGVLCGFLLMRIFLHDLVAKPLAKWYNQRKKSSSAQK
ncbi:MAG: spore cortex biosynthesis protein YabQ [Clostridia bacterium]|nr:spore cortex biosynthesis protein YabQ [Clostridia bacterium]